MAQSEHDKQIDYIEFTSTDIGQTKRFYSSVFGWKFEDYGPDYTSFMDGRIAGGFAKGQPTHGAGALVVLYAAQLEAMEKKIREAGGKIVKGIFSFPGGRRFHFTDPSGNELAVWSEDPNQ